MSVERIPLSTAPSEFVLAPIRTMNAPPTNIADIPEEESNNPCMTYVERESLYTSLPDRVQYLTSFLGFYHRIVLPPYVRLSVTEADADELHEASMILEPHIGTLVDGVYAHLFKFSVTRQVFMPRPGGHEGPMVADLRDLDLDCPQIKERKRFFSMYVRKLIQSDYNDFKTWEYYDKVGLMHTGEAALKHRKLVGKDGLRVDHIHLSATLGWTMDRIIAIILRDESLPISKRESIVRSFHKVMWIQQDLFSRHYVRDGDEYRKSPRTMAGSRLRPQPGTYSASSGDASVSCPMSFGGDTSYDHPHPSNPTSPTQSSASITTSVTGADSVRWTPQAVSGVQVRAPDDHYDTWGKGPVSSQQIPLRSKPSEDWSKAIGRERSASNLEDIHAQVAANRSGVWRRIFGGA